mmetsp:Transcript_10070/g.23296  ORF Transcript_10070/g.23296 Transcript_10070/m.23296 type:complete len:215 (-) Transcript_10070:412-1056(-)
MGARGAAATLNGYRHARRLGAPGDPAGGGHAQWRRSGRVSGADRWCAHSSRPGGAGAPRRGGLAEAAESRAYSPARTAPASAPHDDVGRGHAWRAAPDASRCWPAFARAARAAAAVASATAAAAATATATGAAGAAGAADANEHAAPGRPQPGVDGAAQPGEWADLLLELANGRLDVYSPARLQPTRRRRRRDVLFDAVDDSRSAGRRRRHGDG